MKTTQDALLVTDDELHILKTLRASMGGPYLAALSPEQKVAFAVFMRSLSGHGQFSNAVH